MTADSHPAVVVMVVTGSCDTHIRDEEHDAHCRRDGAEDVQAHTGIHLEMTQRVEVGEEVV